MSPERQFSSERNRSVESRTRKTVPNSLFVEYNPRLKSWVINKLQEYTTILMVFVINRKIDVFTFSE